MPQHCAWSSITSTEQHLRHHSPGGSRSVKRHLLMGAGLAGALVLTLSACASSDRSSDSSATSASSAADASGSVSGDAAAGGPSDPNGQIIFGAAGAPSMFDPLYATDGETFRVVRQMTEGLVGFTPGTADVEPALAQSWEQSADGLTWTFTLAGRRHVPRRNAAGRDGRLLQPRPDVLADRCRRNPGAVLVGHHGRVQGPEERHRRTCPQRLWLVRCTGRRHRRHHTRPDRPRSSRPFSAFPRSPSSRRPH